MGAEAILNQDKPAESTSADPDQILPMVPEVKLGQSTEEREREGRGGPGCRTKRCKFGRGKGDKTRAPRCEGEVATYSTMLTCYFTELTSCATGLTS